MYDNKTTTTMGWSCHNNERHKATKASVLWTVVKMAREELVAKNLDKDMLHHHLQNMVISQDNWESLASDCLV